MTEPDATEPSPPRHAATAPPAPWLRALRLALVGVTVAVGIATLALVPGPADTAGAQQNLHSDWAPFVGEYQMWCTASTGEPGPCARHHNGWAIDIDVTFGDPLYATGPGTIVQLFEGCRARGGDHCNDRIGNGLSIDHGDHWSRYIHLARLAPGLEEGDRIEGGQLVGYSGASGTMDGGVHLHYDETLPQPLPVRRIFFGPMLACHGDQVVQYPDVIVGRGGNWQDVPWGTVLRNDGYECLGGVTPEPLAPPTPPPPPPVEPITAVAAGSVGLAFGDFGAIGRESLVIGVPGDSLGRRTEAGSVTVVTDRARGTRNELLRQGRKLTGRPGAGDYVGASVATGDLDCDGRDDLAVGAPGEKLGRHEDAGLVVVTHGTRRSAANRPIRLAQGGLLGGSRDGNELTGASLAIGDFDGDGCDDLAVGAPGEDIDGNTDAGAVAVAFGHRSGVGAGRTPVVLSRAAGLPGDLAAGDLVGATLAAGDFDCDGIDDLAIGIPGANVGSAIDAGAVAVVHGSTAGFVRPTILWQENGLAGILEGGDHVGAALAVGDFDADGCDDLAVGAPGEGLTQGAAAGAVSIAYGSPAGLADSIVIYRGEGGLRGKAAAGDFLGAALAAGDFDCDGDDDLAVGAPGVTVRRQNDAGWVGVVRGSSAGLRGAMASLVQGRGLPGSAEAGDLVGSSLAAGDFDGDGCADLAIGAPGEDIGRHIDAGEVTLVSGSRAGLAGARTFSQASNLPGRSRDGDVLSGPSAARLLALY
ncbi:MAG: peptidoglycan DD-metalloendopeptidase family protein [Acidimicrobiales bacterium]